MNISTGKKRQAQKVVLYGPEGIGKTSLAAAFPDPLFIDTEGSTASYDVKRAEPAPTSWAMLMSYVDEVRAGRAECSTLVIDTADWAERLCIEKVLADHGKKGIEDFGYGKGYTYVKEEFARLLDKLSDVVAMGVNAVVCAHAMMRKFEQPDEMGAYDRWELKLSKQTAPLVKEWADMVLFLNYQTEVVRDSNGKAKAMGGRRVMHAEHHPAWDAKNRCGLPAKMDLDYARIAAAIPDMRAKKAAPAAEAPEVPMKLDFQEVEPAPAKARPEVDRAIERGEAALAAAKAGKADMQAPGADAKGPVSGNGPEASGKPDVPGHLRPLLDLMEACGASEADVTSYIEAQGWYPAGTPLGSYQPEAVAWLVANWETVKADIPLPFK